MNWFPKNFSMMFITFIFSYIGPCHHSLLRRSRTSNQPHCLALAYGTSLLASCRTWTTPMRPMPLSMVRLCPPPDLEAEEKFTQELVDYNLPPPHQHVDAPVPASATTPPKLSMASPPPSRKRTAKATQRAPGKRRRKASFSELTSHLDGRGQEDASHPQNR